MLAAVCRGPTVDLRCKLWSGTAWYKPRACETTPCRGAVCYSIHSDLQAVSTSTILLVSSKPTQHGHALQDVAPLDRQPSSRHEGNSQWVIGRAHESQRASRSASRFNRVLTGGTLTTAIKASPTWQLLRNLCTDQSTQLNAIHISAALSHLAKLPPPAPPAHAAPRGTYNVASSALQTPRGRVTDVKAAAQQYGEFVCWLAHQSELLLPDLAPRAVANMLWSVATLRKLLTLCRGPTGLQQPLAPAGQLAAHPVQARVEAASPLRVPGLAPGISSTALALQHTEQLALGLSQRAAALAGLFEPQHTSSMLYGLALLGQGAVTGSPPYAAIDASAAPQLHSRGILLMPEPTSAAPPTPAAVTSGQPTAGLAACAIEPTAAEHLGTYRMCATKLLVGCLPQLPRFSPQALSNTAYAIAKLDLEPQEEWMSAYADVVLLRIQDFIPQHYSNTLWALAHVGYYPGDDWLEQVLAATTTKLPVFTPQGLSTVLWSLATLQHVPSWAWLAQLYEEVVAQVAAFEPQDVSTMLWALARMHVQTAASGRGDGTLQALTAQSSGGLGMSAAAAPPGGEPHLVDLGAPLLSSSERERLAVHRCSGSLASIRDGSNRLPLTPTRPAGLGLHNGPMAGGASDRQDHGAHTHTGPAAGGEGVAEGAGADQHGLVPHGTSTTIVESQGHRCWPAAEITPLATCVTSLLGQAPLGLLNGQQLSNIAWALSHLWLAPTPTHTLPEHTSACLTPGNTAGTERSKCHSSNALGTARIPGMWEPQRIAAAAAPLLPTLLPQELASLLGTFARLRVDPGEAWWHRFFAVTCSRVRSCGPGQVAGLLWALASLGVRPPGFWLQPALRTFDASLLEASLQHMAMVLWALVRCGLRPPRPWLQRLVSHFATALSSSDRQLPAEQAGSDGGAGSSEDGRDQATAMVLWSLASLRGPLPAGVLPVLVEALGTHVASCSAQGFAMSMWALSMLGSAHLPPPAFMAGSAKRLLAIATSSGVTSSAPPNTMVLPAGLAKAPPHGKALHDSAKAVVSAPEATGRVQLDASRIGTGVSESPGLSSTLNSRAVATILFAFAVLKYHPGQACLAAVARLLLQQCELLRPQHVARALWAFARLGEVPGQLWLQAMLRQWQRGRTSRDGSARMVDAKTLRIMREACIALGVLRSTGAGGVPGVAAAGDSMAPMASSEA